MEPRDTKGRIGPQDGERADFPRLGNRFIVRSDDTGGRFALLEHTVPARALAAPTHTHEHEDEYSFVLNVEGERDVERIGAIQAKYGLSMDIESIGPLTQEHGLQA